MVIFIVCMSYVLHTQYEKKKKKNIDLNKSCVAAVHWTWIFCIKELTWLMSRI